MCKYFKKSFLLPVKVNVGLKYCFLYIGSRILSLLPYKFQYLLLVFMQFLPSIAKRSLRRLELIRSFIPNVICYFKRISECIVNI